MKELKILYLEDSPHDAEFTGRILKSAGVDFTFKLVDTKEDYQHALGEYTPDIILADHSLFHFNSSEALQIFKQYELKIPFILVTGTVSEEFAVNILKEGADDYLLKDNLVRLPNAILNSLEKYRLDRERKEYLDNVILNEAMMKEAQALALFGSWEADIVTGKVQWSDEIFRIYGYEPGEIKPGHDVILHHIHPDDRMLYQKAMYTLLKEYDNSASEIRIIDKNSLHKFVYFKIVVKRNNDGELTRLIGFMQDVTEKRKLEKELADHQMHQQKLITEITIHAQEKERNELGRELHDNINQVLAMIKMYLDLAVQRPDKREDLIRQCSDNVSYVIQEIRKLSKSLVAPSLGDIGLEEALRELIEEINVGDQLHVELDTAISNCQQTDKSMELMLYRIAQEQLNNIRKYARAKKATITLRVDDKNIFFSISDDGLGFDTTQRVQGIGIKNIRSRVSFYSGIMYIISAPGAGCTINITLPL